MRTITEIEADLKAATAARANFRATINEGQGGYVDETKIEELTAELHEATRAAKDAEWTADVTAERRAWANSQGFKTALEMLNGCRAKGFELSDLKHYVAKHA